MQCNNFTLLPFSGECSGHGTCINNICVCSEPWESNHDFLHLAASGVTDCITHKTGRYWVILHVISRRINIYMSPYSLIYNIVCRPTYVLLGICTLYSLWRLYSFAPLSICAKNSKGKRQTVIPHLWTLFSAISSFCMFSTMTLTVFNMPYQYLRENLYIVIVGGILASCMFFVNVSLQGTLLVQLTLRSVKTKDTSRLLLQMQLILSLIAIANSAVWIVCHLGVHFASSLEMSFLFSRSFPLSLSATSVLWIIVNIKWSNDIIKSLQNHLSSMESMLKGEVARSAADLSKIEGALVRLKQLRTGSSISFGIMGIFGIIAGVMPVLMQFWFATVSVAVLGAMSTLYSLRPHNWRL